MNSTWYINFAWAVGGIIAGYIGGMTLNKSDGYRFRAAAGLVVLVLVAVSAVLNYENALALKNSVICQRDFNTRYRQSLQAQLDSASIVNRASKAFLQEYIKDISPERRAAASQEYFSRSDEAEKVRAANPLPIENTC